VKKGVNFDVGHGQGSFSFGVARGAMSQGVEPNTISSDLHRYNVNGPVFDLITTASKFIHLGMSLEKVMAKITSIPAEFLGMTGKVGTLAPGAYGDVVVSEEEEGDFVLEDTMGVKEVAHRLVRPVCVVKGGRVVVDRIAE
jgi:dihydroorotase